MPRGNAIPRTINAIVWATRRWGTTSAAIPSGWDQILAPHRVTMPRRTVPSHVARPTYAESGVPQPASDRIHLIDTASELAKLRAACLMAAETLNYACSLVAVGVTTEALDESVHAWIVARNAYPSPLNYRGFPKAICTSVNNVACHGIPDDRPLRSGDVVNLDVSVFFDGSVCTS